MGGEKLAMKAYGKVKIKRINPSLDDIPNDCGYGKKFRFNIDMNANGIGGDLIEWCQINCNGKWGWWFEPTQEIVNPLNHWEHQNAYMSFQRKKDATKFWLSVGVARIGQD